jgi:hypothetical protein
MPVANELFKAMKTGSHECSSVGEKFAIVCLFRCSQMNHRNENKLYHTVIIANACILFLNLP